MKLAIRDQDDTPQGFPLKRLFCSLTRALEAESVELHVLRSQGYGLTVTEWDNRLDDEDSILVDEPFLSEILEGVDQWFYWLDVKVVTEDTEIRFGLHDSSLMYIEAPDKLLNLVAEDFSHVEWIGRP
jgi:hypothetical protein